MPSNRELHRLAILALAALLGACSGPDTAEINNKVESVIIVGTSVTKQIYVDGSYGLTLLPKDEAGKTLLGRGLRVDITIDNPNGYTSQVDDTECAAPAKDAGLSVGVIIDDSSSMSGNDAMLRRKDAAIAFLDTLNEGDEVLLADYGPSGNSARDILCASQTPTATCAPARATGFSDDLDALRAATSKIVASGSTPLYGSCAQIVPLVASRMGRNQAILLLSDGLPGDTNKRAACHDAATAAGIPMFTVGLGPAAEGETKSQSNAVRVLRELATATGASYASANEPELLSALFASIGEALTQGKCSSEAILNEYQMLKPGVRIQGTVHVGTKEAMGKFEFVAPAMN